MRVIRKQSLHLSPLALTAVVCFVLAGAGHLVQARGTLRSLPSKDEESLKRFLQTFDKEKTFGKDKATRYVAAFPDLNGDRVPEAIVYLISDEWCGSGGCNTLVLARQNDSWRILTNITITLPPIRVLKNTSHGWHGISVRVQGGGIQPGYEAELDFDGKTYPTNPSVAPARPLTEKPEGQVVIPSLSGAKALYPSY